MTVHNTLIFIFTIICLLLETVAIKDLLDWAFDNKEECAYALTITITAILYTVTSSYFVINIK